LSSTVRQGKIDFVILLKDVDHPFRRLLNAVALEQNFPAGRGLEAGHQFKQGRLAAARGADD
jgi:hypothetical protein